jgi:nitronate monooxygenase
MSIRSALTELFGLEYPIVLAPMGGIAGGRLAAAVSAAGGLGLVGGGYGDPAWLRTELELVRAGTQRPWGVGLITWHTSREVVELALGYEPHAFLLSFGDPRPFAPAIKAAGCRLICQVQDVEAARVAVAAGADVLVAQGAEAGGHGAIRATLPLVPAVVDAVASLPVTRAGGSADGGRPVPVLAAGGSADGRGPVPVVAAGGIADGRGLAAALMLGAQGAMIGTRFYAAAESLGHERARQRIVAAHAGDTAHTHVFDIVRGYAWPEPYSGRALRNRFFERWDGHEDALHEAVASEAPTYWSAVEEGDFDTAVIFAGEAVELIDSVATAGDLVRRIGSEAEARLRAGADLLR